MDNVQKLQLRQSELKVQINEMLESTLETRSATFTADLGNLTRDAKGVEVELQAAIIAAPDTLETRKEYADNDAEGRELLELRSQTDFGRYIAAAMTGGGVRSGAELEYNQARNIPEDRFSLELLTRDLGVELETRAAIAGDAKTNQGSWLDRLFADTAASRLGITFPSVGPGIASYPVVTAGGTPAQRAKVQAAAAGTFTVAVSELKPTRNAVHLLYTIEDDARLPGLSSAVMRDMRGAMTAQIDKSIYVGDTGATGTDADITGLTHLAIGETTITQANKVKADELLSAILNWVDGTHAINMADVRLVVTVGSNKLWGSTIHAATVDNQTIAQFLRDSGVMYTVKGDVEAATGNGKFGAFAGLQRGIAGAGVAPIWESAQLVRDPYTSAAKGEVALTLNYLWNFGLPRLSNFKRLKYVN